ncbi:unnamed protein product [Withania somnifera]
MATAPVKSQPLHYFSLPQLKWGSSNHHRFRRRDSPPSTGNNPPPPPPLQTVNCGGGSDEHEQEVVVEEEQEEEVVETTSLWNLRPRKSETVSLKKVEVRDESGNGNHVMQRSQRLRENGDGYGVVSGKKGKSKLWISLSREEIEEDVYSMTGSRPARRPKKRSKTIQKQLDNAFPGLYLVGLTADSFRVNDTTFNGGAGYFLYCGRKPPTDLSLSGAAHGKW